MRINDFCKEKNLDLIPAANEKMTLGDKYSKSIFGKLDAMNSNLVYDLLSAGVITKDEKDSILNKLRNAERADTEFGNLIVKNKVEHSDDLNIPGLFNLGLGYSSDKNIKYEFSSLTSLVLRDDIRYELDAALDEMKEKHWNKYKDEVRSIYIIERLVFGNVRVIADKSLKTEIKAEIEKSAAKSKLKDQHEGSKHISFVFENQKVPFAMELVKGKKFDS